MTTETQAPALRGLNEPTEAADLTPEEGQTKTPADEIPPALRRSEDFWAICAGLPDPVSEAALFDWLDDRGVQDARAAAAAEAARYRRRLVCRTSYSSDFQDGYTHAVVHLCPAAARRLLEYRDLLPALQRHDSNFYVAEFFDTSVDYGDLTENDWQGVGDHLDIGDWWTLPSGAEMEPAGVTADCLCVTKRGVHWSASSQYSGAAFETERITWAELEQVRDGFWPFPDGPRAEDVGDAEHTEEAEEVR